MKKSGFIKKLFVLMMVVCVISSTGSLNIARAEEGNGCTHEHVSDWIVDVIPTVTYTGLKHQICTDCRKTVAVEEIPTVKTNETGDEIITDLGVSRKYTVSGNNAPELTINTALPTLRRWFFDNHDETILANGGTVSIWLDVREINKTVSTSEKQMIEDKYSEMLGTYKSICFFRVTLHKTSEGKDQTMNESGTISITMKVPEDMISTDTATNREYHIVRVHDDAPAILFGTFDKENKTFTFSTDKFSTYALVCRDVPKNATSGSQSAGGTSGTTGTTTDQSSTGTTGTTEGQGSTGTTTGATTDQGSTGTTGTTGGQGTTTDQSSAGTTGTTEGQGSTGTTTGTSDVTKTDGKPGTNPATGETAMKMLVIYGMLALVTGGALVFLRKKKVTK